MTHCINNRLFLCFLFYLFNLFFLFFLFFLFEFNGYIILIAKFPDWINRLLFVIYDVFDRLDFLITADSSKAVDGDILTCSDVVERCTQPKSVFIDNQLFLESIVNIAQDLLLQRFVDQILAGFGFVACGKVRDGHDVLFRLGCELDWQVGGVVLQVVAVISVRSGLDLPFGFLEFQHEVCLVLHARELGDEHCVVAAVITRLLILVLQLLVTYNCVAKGLHLHIEFAEYLLEFIHDGHVRFVNHHFVALVFVCLGIPGIALLQNQWKYFIGILIGRTIRIRRVLLVGDDFTF